MSAAIHDDHDDDDVIISRHLLQEFPTQNTSTTVAKYHIRIKNSRQIFPIDQSAAVGTYGEQEGSVLSCINAYDIHITAAMNVICSTTAPVGTRLHWSTDCRPAWTGEKRWVTVEAGRRSVAVKRQTKNNLDKDCSSHTHTRMHLRLVPIHSVVWLRVKHWACCRSQLVAAE